MAKLIWVKGSKGVWGYSQLNKYDIVSSASKPGNVTLLRFKYDAATHGASPDHPPKGLVEVKDATFSAGGDLTGGTIQSMKWLTGSGKVILKTDGLSYDASKLAGISPSAWYNEIFKVKTTFVGSNHSGGKDWDGDVIITTTGNDKVFAKGGNDFLTDEGGRDTYNGGGGSDHLSYASSNLAVKANLANDTAVNGGKTDKLVSIEGIRGTKKADKLIGNAADNRFEGLKGADVIDGGAGTEDEVRYHKDAQYGGNQGIVANLGKGTVKDGFGTIDTIKNIERVRGTEKADKFIDNGGKDGFMGEGGKDTFVFKGGDDWANGGAGADKFIFQGKFGYDWIGDFNAGEGDRLKIVGANFGDVTVGESSRGNAKISYNGQTVELDGVNQADVDGSWFL